jgi:hypothetical protein
MATVDDLDEVIEQLHLALGDFVKGNPEPVKQIFSHQEDVTLANPLGPPRVGGSRLLRLWSVPHRSSEMASSLASRR